MAALVAPVKLRDQIVQCVGQYLTEYMFNTERPEEFSPFCSRAIPQMSITDYVKRIGRYTQCSDEVLVLALRSVVRLQLNDDLHLVNAYSVHRLFITAVLVHAKFYDDVLEIGTNGFYAHVGGVPTRELNVMEVAFLSMTNFDLDVEPGVYALDLQTLLKYDYGSDESIVCEGLVSKNPD